ncbi:MAG: hypothetical protein J5J00_13545 [Deltaproteobacteria bacterium]|nr:hypothetical protein [Deltaproteobacteria bacterium]
MSLKDQTKAAFQKYSSAARINYNKLSSRERVLIIVPLLVIGVLSLHFYIIQPVSATFASQRETIAALDTQVKVFGEVIKEYSRLKARRHQIEEEYKEVATTDSPRAVLENLIKSKLGLPPRDFTLPDPRTEEFGGGYEKTSVSVQLRNITELDKLVAFLKEVVHGPNPFMIKHLNLDKGMADRYLRVDLEASSIRRK